MQLRKSGGGFCAAFFFSFLAEQLGELPRAQVMAMLVIAFVGQPNSACLPGELLWARAAVSSLDTFSRQMQLGELRMGPSAFFPFSTGSVQISQHNLGFVDNLSRRNRLSELPEH